MGNMEKYNQIFTEIFDVDVKNSKDDLTESNIDKWDSISLIGFITRCEEVFHISIHMDDISEIDSYQKGIYVLKKYGVKFERILQE